MSFSYPTNLYRAREIAIPENASGEYDELFIITELEEEDFQCESCGRAFSTDLSLQDHIRTTHGEDSVQCMLCARTFKSRKYLSMHLKAVHKRDSTSSLGGGGGYTSPANAEPRTFPCPECGKLFQSRTGLKNHMPNHNPDKKLCPICNNTFKDAERLKVHISRIHERTFAFSCRECGKSFFTKWELQIHFLRHLKVIQCAVCDEVFPNATALLQHKKVHRRERMARNSMEDQLAVGME